MPLARRLFDEKNCRVPVRKAIALILIGGIVYASHAAFALWGIARNDASLHSLVLCIYPIHVVLIQFFLRRDRLTLMRSAALIVCVFGLALLLGVSTANMDGIGLICSFISSMLYAAYVLLGAEIRSETNPAVTCAYIMSGTMVSFVFAGLLSGNLCFEIVPQGWHMTILMATVGGTLPFLLTWTGIEHIGPVRACIIGMVEPISTVVLDFLVFQKTLSSMQWIGTGIVLLAVTITQLPTKSTTKQLP